MRTIASIVVISLFFLFFACTKDHQTPQQRFKQKSIKMVQQSAFTLLMDSCTAVIQKFNPQEIGIFAQNLSEKSQQALTQNDMEKYLRLRIVRASLGYNMGGPNLPKALERATDTANLYKTTFGEKSTEYLTAKLIKSWIIGDGGDIQFENREVLEVLNILSDSEIEGKNSLIAECYNTLGIEAHLANDHMNELIYLKKAEQVLLDNEDCSFNNPSAYYTWLGVCNSLAVCYTSMQDFVNGEYYANICLNERIQHGLSHPMIAISHMLKARAIAYLKGNKDSALSHIQEAMNLCQVFKPELYFSYSGYEAEILAKYGDTSSALQKYQSLLEMYNYDSLDNKMVNVAGSQCYKLARIYLQRRDQMGMNQVNQRMQLLEQKYGTALYPYLRSLLLSTQAELIAQNGNSILADSNFSFALKSGGRDYKVLLSNQESLPENTPYNLVNVFSRYAIFRYTLSHKITQTERRREELVNVFHINKKIVDLLNDKKSFFFNQNANHVLGESEWSSQQAIEQGLQCLYELDTLSNEGFVVAGSIDSDAFSTQAGRMQAALELIEASKANLLETKLQEDKVFQMTFTDAENQERVTQLRRIDTLFALFQHSGDQALQGKMNSEITQYSTVLARLRKKYQLSEIAELPLDLKKYREKSKGQAIFNYFMGSHTLFTLTAINGELSFSRQELPGNFSNDIRLVNQKFLNPHAIKSLTPKDLDSFKKIRSGWYTLLLDSTLEKNQQIKKLVIIPSGRLNEINFDLLNSGKTKDSEYLIQQYPISYQVSGAIFLAQTPKTEVASGLVAFAAQNFQGTSVQADFESGLRGGLTDLRFAIQEAKIVAEVTEGQFFAHTTGELFNSEVANYGVLHISTHAIASKHVSQPPYLVFEKHDETYSSINTTELGLLKLKASLCMLSACQTGLGDHESDEGVFSLGRGFMNQGVPSVGVSMWSLPDTNSSVEIMRDFYEGIQSGMEKSQALRNAKLKYLKNVKDPLLRLPYFWAGMVLIGDDQPIQIAKVGSGLKPWWTLGALGLMLGALFYFRRSKKA